MNKFLKIFFCIVFVPYLTIGCLSSCKTTKTVTKEVIKEVEKYDSTAINEVVRLKRVLSETIEKHRKEKERWDSTGISFFDPCPDSARTVTKIVFDNGKLKLIEGNVRSLSQTLHEKSTELLDAYSTIDSIAVELEKAQAALKRETEKEEKIVYRDVERKVGKGLMWLWILIGIVIGLSAEYKFKLVKRILSLVKLIK